MEKTWNEKDERLTLFVFKMWRIIYLRDVLKHVIYLDMNNLYSYAMSKFLPTSGFKWIDLKEFDMNKYTSNSSKECVFEVYLE